MIKPTRLIYAKMTIFELPDEALMDMVKASVLGAFDEIVRRYEPKFLSHAARSVNNKDTAEDIVQETFTSIWEERNTFDKNIAKFSTWAYTILHNKINDFLRIRYSERFSVSLSCVEEDKDSLAVSAAWFESLSESKLLKLKEIVLRYLTKKDQELFRLKEVEGISYKEICALPEFKGVEANKLMKRRERYIARIIEAMEIEKYEKPGK